MARRRQNNLLENLFDFAAGLQWWESVGVAVVLYLALGLFAGALSPVFKIFGTLGQYFLPCIFLLGALKSAVSSTKNKSHTVSDRSPNPPTKKAEPTLQRTDSGTDLYELWKSPAIGAAVAVAPPPDRWSLDLLRAIDWKRFEELCAAYFRQLGFRADTQSHGPDGGIDITLYSPEDPQRISGVVQCKRWNSMVGPKLMRELLGVMTANKVPEGIFITSSTFNDDATQFANKNKIDLIDGARLLSLIHDRPAADQARLLEVATEGDYLTPSCPSCGRKLVKRENSKDKSKFWSCANYRCKFTMDA